MLLVVQHDEQGSFGLVLNRPTEFPLPQLFSSLDCEWRGDEHEVAYWGGPVANDSGWMLFGESLELSQPREDAEAVADGIYFANSIEIFQKLAADPKGCLRFFIGYAGWGPGQLESEISQGAWLSAEATPGVVLEGEPGAMWGTVVRGLGVDPGRLVATAGVH